MINISIKQVFSTVIGNETLKNKIRSDILSNSLSHAYIIEGRRGSGRHTIAYMIAAALSCQNSDDRSMPIPCLECAACRKILQKKSPDVIVIGRDDKATIGVDTIRFLRNDIYTVPNDLNYKIYIIEDADTLTHQAQNAFLLTLEEPPEYVKYFLLCENADTLLETIRSRAQTLRTTPVVDKDIDQYLCENHEKAKSLKLSDPQTYQEIIMASEGCIGRAIEYLDPATFSPVLKRRALAKSFVNAIVNKERGEKIISLISKFDSKRDGLLREIQTVSLALRDLIALQKSENVPLCFYCDRDEAISLSDSTNLRRLMEIYDALLNVNERIEANANVRLSLIKLFSEINLL